MKIRRIAYISCNISHTLSQQIWFGLKRRLDEEGHSLVLFSGAYIDESTQKPTTDPWFFQFANAASVDGLVVYGAPFGQYSGQETVQSFLESFDLPLVNIGLPVTGFPSVVVDDTVGIRAMVQRLIVESGYRDFGWIGGPEANQENRIRRAAVVAALEPHGLSLSPQACANGCFSIDSGVYGVGEILKRLGRCPRVLCCIDDDTAAGAIAELQRRGYRIPEDVAVTGFDDSIMAQSTIPPITTVRQRMEDQGYYAADLLLRRLNGETISDHTLDTVAVFRESAGYFVSGHTDSRRLAKVVGALRSLVGSALADSRTGPVFPVDGKFIKACRRILEVEADMNLDLYMDAVDECLGELLATNDQNFARQAGPFFHYAGRVAASHRLQYDTVDRIRTVGAFQTMSIVNQELESAIDPVSLERVLPVVNHLLGAAGFCMLTRRDGHLSVDYLDDESSTHGLRSPAEVMELFLARFQREAPPASLSIVVPIIYAGQGLGFLALVLNQDTAFLADLLAASVAACLQRIELLDRLKRSLDDLERTTARMIRSERLAALGTLVTGIAHELNTPLGTALTLCSGLAHQRDGLQGHLQSGALSRKDMDSYLTFAAQGHEVLIKSIERAIHLVTLFRQVAVEDQGSRPETFAVHGVVNWVVQARRPMLEARGIRVFIEIDPESSLHSFPASLRHVLEQVLDNAMHHAWDEGQGGTVHIREQPAESAYLELQVSDDGKGGSPVTLAHFYDPFFTTRRSDGFIGLGGYIIYSMVHTVLRGDLQISGGKGWTVTLRLPRDIMADPAFTAG